MRKHDEKPVTGDLLQDYLNFADQAKALTTTERRHSFRVWAASVRPQTTSKLLNNLLDVEPRYK